MRIAQVLPYAELGGTEQHCLTLCRELASRHELTLVCPPGPAVPRFAGLRHVPFPRWDRELGRGIREYLAALRSLEVDLIHIHAAPELVLFARRAVRRPLVFTVHGLHGSGSAVSYAAARLASRFADQTICVSQAEQARVPGSALVYNGVPDPGFTPPPESGLVGYVGRLEPGKGAQVLLRSGVRPLLIVGDGSQRAALEAEAGPGVAFVGYQEHPSEFIARCDILAVPSLAEAFSLAAAEAAAVGRPVVASNTGGLPEVIEDNVTGLLVPPNDPAALGQALRRLLADPSLARRMGLAARERYLAHFSAARMAEATEQVYEAAAAIRTGP